MKLRLISAVLCLCALLALAPGAAAQTQTAEDISKQTTLTGTGYDSFGFLTDGNLTSYRRSNGNVTLTLENKNGIGALYFVFDLEYGAYTILDNTTGNTITAGEYGFLHEYVQLPEAATSVTVKFENGKVRLSEIRVFSPGDAPADVQVWDKPQEGGADIVLFTTHGDDDQLFFAGLLPLYAGEKDARVQAVYLTDHRNLTNERTHEMLNGLWAVGVTAYPVFGEFSDFRIDDLDGTYREYASQGVSKEALLGFVVEQLRRFKPLVAIGHDIKGEYGHGMHMVYTDCLIKALDVSNDPELAERYGVWDVPKTYLHLYEQNPIELDYDTPLESFDGMTAFQVSQKLGYPCHKSQQYTWFTRWINGSNNEITKATQIATYNPCKFGLYRSTVGEDVQKNDFLENVTTYAEQERLEQERLEQERLEQERLEQERLEQERLEQEKLEQEQPQSQSPTGAPTNPSEKKNDLHFPIECAIIPKHVKRRAHAPIAQLDRVTDYESVGRGFESLSAYQTVQIRTFYQLVKGSDLLFISTGTRKIKCGADERHSRRLDGAKL